MQQELTRIWTIGVVLALVGLILPAAAVGEGGNGLCIDLNPLLEVGCKSTQSVPPSGSAARSGSATPASSVTSAEASALDGPVLGSPTTVRYDPRRLTVTFERGTPRRTVERIFASAHVSLERAVPEIGAYMVGVEPARRAAALAALQRSSRVVSAGREVLAGALQTDPNDADWPQQWGLRLIGFPRAWTATRGSSRVVVAVVDTGVDPNQPDLRGALVPGYDFVNSDADPRDDHGHGTAVAGVVAARADNGEGVAGVCSSCSIMPVKVLDNHGSGDYTVIAAGIVWAADHGARVINLSLGGPAATAELDNAVAYAVNKGAVVMAAAGNSGTTVPFYPAASPRAISVAATTISDQPYPWTNFGNWVALAAPGCNVAPVLAGGYGTFCGTSSATPVVSGLAALELSVDPSADVATVADALRRAATPLPNLVQFGRIDALRTLSLIRPAEKTTSVLRGSVNARTPTRSYTFDVTAGTFTARLSFSRARTLQLSLVPDGVSTPLARTAGTGSLQLEQVVAAGRVRLVVSGGRVKTPFVLRVSYLRGSSG